ncbi:MAG: asparagine synthase (glutamine-hydrolyzing) [Pyrinomonadaceae bacterium]|nr:asparagine synthase (glutamine-hydrolyzing) [Pyrinomonadaceae bacterium]
MCGISGIFGTGWKKEQLAAMVSSQHHRGPDAQGIYFDPAGRAALGHNRLSIIDLSPAGQQPMSTPDGRYHIVFNGEVYNYLELRAQLSDYQYHSETDTEVVLAAYQRWGKGCLDRFLGMFAFLIWDTQEKSLFAARDRFGVKPLNYYVNDDGTLFTASEIKALHATGLPAEFDQVTWATYLSSGAYDHSNRTFWTRVKALPAGHTLTWQNCRIQIRSWYDLAERSGTELDQRPLETVQEEYLALLADSVRLRFRSDVPVGINLSGGVDSSTLLGLVQQFQGSESEVSAYTFVTGDKNYDELPWVEQMLSRTHHPLRVCKLTPEMVPELATSVQSHQDEPFGGLPTLAYARLFEEARADGTIVLLDGQGMDEQWAGYDYYVGALNGNGLAGELIQGTMEPPVRPSCLTPEFLALAKPFIPQEPFPDKLRNMQYRDALFTKIPRALRFNDRVSMRSSTELREPFLDHRLFELALRQPTDRKIINGTRKWLLRQVSKQLLPEGVVDAAKRPLQTPQREWLRGSLRSWATACLEEALADFGGDYLDESAVREGWQSYCNSEADSSFHVWQWISLGLMRGSRRLQVPLTHGAVAARLADVA